MVQQRQESLPGLPIPSYLQYEHEHEHDDNGHNKTSTSRHGTPSPASQSLPSETELVLLCLDYLRDLRRSYEPHAHASATSTSTSSSTTTTSSGDDLLREAERLDGNWISLAIYALSRSFVGTDNDLRDAFVCGKSGSSACSGNDAWFDPQRAVGRQSSPLLQIKIPSAGATAAASASAEIIAIPSSMADINREILLLPPDRDPQKSASSSSAPMPAAASNSSGSPSRSKASRLAAIKSGSGSGSTMHSASHSHSYASLYPHDDAHPSNLHRFYTLNGLGGGAGGATCTAGAGAVDDGNSAAANDIHTHARPPLTLGELTAAGLAGLGARSRLDAERDMVRSDLFGQFLTAVRQKGFFDGTAPPIASSIDDTNDDDDNDAHDEINAAHQQKYEERYRKVVAKFRTKLATKAAAAAAATATATATTAEADGVDAGGRSVVSTGAAVDAARKQMARRQRRIAAAMGADVGAVSGGMAGTCTAAAVASAMEHANTGASTRSHAADPATTSSSSAATVPGAAIADTTSIINQTDLDEAERLKSVGNSHMQKKEYEQAVDAYTSALKLCPSGPSSHVYFSNRAAAHLSMKSFEEAIRDSERSLALKPDYAKAHARLGLAQFLLGRFGEAVEAYEVALCLDPDNKASRSYLEKARKKLAAQQTAEETKPMKDENNVATSSAPSNSTAVESAPPAATSPTTGGSSPTKTREQIRIDEKEASRFKSKGNAAMAARDYDGAIAAYTTALELSPDGASSHVFYSNRAAALCYLERYEEAEMDSETSIRLRPEYGKGWARLGLSRFFLRDYGAAVSAYQEALKYEPDNPASRSYLQKAMRKLEEEEADG